jgi:hypothetical protein
MFVRLKNGPVIDRHSISRRNEANETIGRASVGRPIDRFSRS